MTMKFITWDVEHGSAAYIKTPNGKHIAVDLGARRATDAGFRPLAYLRQNYSVTQLDAVIITHPHLDHIEDIMNFDGLSPKSFRRPSHLTEGEIWGTNQNAPQEIQQIIQKYIATDKRYNQPSTVETDLSIPSNFGGVHFQLFTPVTPPRTNINNHSIVTVMTYQGVKFLMPGDNEPPSWNELLARPEFVTAIKGTHVLVAPHHGRESGYHAPLFKIINPLLTIISDGRFVDTSATSRYSTQSKGWKVSRRNGNPQLERKCVTTRNDGAIDIVVSPSNQPGNVGSMAVTIN